MQVIIFSYNRPAQLDLLLRSMKKFTDFTDVTVLYLYQEEFENGYEIVQKEHPEIKFVYRLKSLSSCVSKTLQGPITLFLCDDDIFINKVSLNDRQFKIFAKRDEILCLSLRMSKTMNYCFDSDAYMEIPEFDEDNAWVWPYYRYDWRYPMSLSGHVFRTKEIKKLLRGVKYNTPTQMESYMAEHPIQKPLMMCYPTQKVVEAPINIVQSECFTNRTGSIDYHNLNNEFMKGKRINLNSILKDKFVGCHQLIKVKWNDSN